MNFTHIIWLRSNASSAEWYLYNQLIAFQFPSIVTHICKQDVSDI